MDDAGQLPAKRLPGGVKGKRGPYKVLPTAKGEPKRRISPKIDQAVSLMLQNPNMLQKDVAALVGVRPDWLCKQLRKDHVNAYLTREAEREIRAGLTVRHATRRYMSLIHAESEKVAADVSSRFMEVNGVLPSQKGSGTRVGVNVSVRGYAIDLSEPAGPVIDAQAQVISE